MPGLSNPVVVLLMIALFSACSGKANSGENSPTQSSGVVHAPATDVAPPSISELIKRLPTTVGSIVVIDLAAIRRTTRRAAFRTLLQTGRLRQALPNGVEGLGLQDMQRVDMMLLATLGSADDVAIALFQGPGLAATFSSADNTTVQSYQKTRYECRQDACVAHIAGSTVLADKPLLKGMIDADLGAADSRSDKRRLRALMRQVDTNAEVWLASTNLPLGLPIELSAFALSMSMNQGVKLRCYAVLASEAAAQEVQASVEKRRRELDGVYGASAELIILKKMVFSRKGAALTLSLELSDQEYDTVIHLLSELVATL